MNFAEALALLEAGSAFRLANNTRPPANYLFATLLPETPRPTYHISSGNMVVRPTMARAVGMDSVYPRGGAVSITEFREETAKFAIDVPLSEKMMRDMQAFLLTLAGNPLGGTGAAQTVSLELLNFFDKVVMQALLDNAEYLRGEALIFHQLNLQSDQITINVDYQIPSQYRLPASTGTNAYYGSTSKFWSDWYQARKLLRNQVAVAICHPDTIISAIGNDANKMRTIGQDEFGSVVLRRYTGTTEQFSTDVRDTISLTAYDLEGEFLDIANPGNTVKVPFMPRGKILFIGMPNASRGYRVGEGATNPNPNNDLPVGYYHLAPTVEGNAMGRWGRVYSPQDYPWMVRGQAVGNELPVIEAYNKIVVATTDMPP